MTEKPRWLPPMLDLRGRSEKECLSILYEIFTKDFKNDHPSFRGLPVWWNRRILLEPRYEEGFWQGEVKGIERLIKNELSQQKEDKYLQSIPCVGWWGAAVFLGELGDLRKYPRARSIEKLAGLNLYCKQSGKMESRLKITHRGRSLLRKMAYQLAVSGTHGGEEFSEFYHRKLNRGTPKVSALVALGAKILWVMYGVAKNEEEYRPLKERAGDAVSCQKGPVR